MSDYSVLVLVCLVLSAAFLVRFELQERRETRRAHAAEMMAHIVAYAPWDDAREAQAHVRALRLHERIAFQPHRPSVPINHLAKARILSLVWGRGYTLSRVAAN